MQRYKIVKTVIYSIYDEELGSYTDFVGGGDSVDTYQRALEEKRNLIARDNEQQNAGLSEENKPS